MTKLISYIAISANGKIARVDGSVDWLENVPNPEGLDYGYYDFYENIGTTIQGNATYRQVLEWGVEFPYKGKENYVFSRQIDLQDDENVHYVTQNHLEKVKSIKASAKQNIWLIGGGQLNAWFLDHGLMDEIRLFLMPIAIPEGKELFAGLVNDHQLKLKKVQTYPNGVLQLIYDCKG